MKINGFGFFIDQIFFDDEGGGPSVQELPEVPTPGEGDVEVLAGDEDEEETEEEVEEESEEEEEEEKPKKKSKTEDDEEEPDINEEEDEEETEEKDEKPEEKPEKIPSLKAIKEKYPNFFKEFPHVRAALGEHQQFRNLFTSMDEAREAVENHQNFMNVSDELLEKGNFEFLYNELEKADRPATVRLMKNVLPTLFEKNRELYMDITELPIKQFISAAHKRAQGEGNKNLENATLHMWKFLTGKAEVPSAKAEKDPRDEEFQQRVTEFENKKFIDARNTVNNDIRTGLVDLIDKAIDPKGRLKETTKKALLNQLIRDIDEEIVGDDNHMSRVERLWINARRSSYANGHMSRIINAYLERAKQILPKHARKVREENNIAVEEEKPERRSSRQEDEPAPRPHSFGGAPRSKTLRDTNPRQIDWRKSKDEDILGGKAFLRKRQ